MVKNPLRILCIIIMSAVLIAPSLTFERNAYAADNGCGVMITVEESTKELMNNGQSHIEMSFSRDNTINDILTNLKRWQMDGYYASNFETTDMVLMEGVTRLDNSKKLSEIAGDRQSINVTFYVPHKKLRLIVNNSNTGYIEDQFDFFPTNYIYDHVPMSFTEGEEKGGHIFEGWYLEKSFKTKQLIPFIMDRDITLYGKWNHTEGAPVREKEVAATCTEPGSYDEVVYCNKDGCKYEMSRTGKTTDALGHDWGEWEVTTPATEDAKGVETRTCKNDSSHRETRDIPQIIVYRNTEGAGATWEEGGSEGLSFIFKRSVNDEETFSHFTGITVDGKDVAASNYTAVSGSVNITLKPDYLKTLSVGKHTLTALFDDSNNAEAAFYIAAADSDSDDEEAGKSPKTGDDNQIILWSSTLFLSAALITILVIRKRRLEK